MNIKSGIYALVVMFMLLMLANSCSKKDVTNDPIPSTTVTDIDGNVYHTIKIGTQTWMAENLKTTKYRNGDPIPNETGNAAWAALTTGAQCIYIGNVYLSSNLGKLYNWYAVHDSRNLTPAGWHIPTDLEWSTLTTYVENHPDSTGSIAKALAAKTDWMTYFEANTVGNDMTKNNSIGLSLLPGGHRLFEGTFQFGGSDGTWWCSDVDTSDKPWIRIIKFNYGVVVRGAAFDKKDGRSVRCIKD